MTRRETTEEHLRNDSPWCVSLAASHYPVDAPVVDEYLRVSRATGTAAFPLTPLPMTSTRTRRDPDHISSVVRFDLPRLGSVSGLDMVHLQCHISTDTLSLARSLA